MLSLLIVGSSRTRMFATPDGRSFVYTPRGRLADRAGHDGPFHRRRAGAPDLITVRGLRLVRSCPVVLYAGSLVPREVIAQAGRTRP